jgi:hypothetical protein
LRQGKRASGETHGQQQWSRCVGAPIQAQRTLDLADLVDRTARQVRLHPSSSRILLHRAVEITTLQVIQVQAVFRQHKMTRIVR